MARVAINTGATPNDGTGDNLRSAGGIINDNFLEIYSYLGAGSTSNLASPMWGTTGAGINTTRNVGIGTTNPRFPLEVGAVGASGTSLYVNGNARITGIVTIGTSSITLNGTTNKINVGSGVTIDGATGTINASAITIGGTSIAAIAAGTGVTYITAGSGISVNQNTGNVTITGTGVTYITAGSGISVNQSSGNVIITATGGGGGGFSGVATSVDITDTNGLTTIYYPTFVENRTVAQNVRADVDLTYRTDTNTLSVPSLSIGTSTTVAGTTFTNQLSVSGVSTFTGVSNFTQGMTVNNAGINLATDSPIYFGNAAQGYISYSSGLFQVRAPGGGTSLVLGAGPVAGANVRITSGDANTNYAVFSGAGVTITGTTFTNQLSISGVSTFNSTLNGLYLNNSTYVKGTSNIAIGQDALLNHTNGDNSIAIGYRSLYNASNVNFSNIGLGYQSGYNVTNGVLNTLLGYKSGYEMLSGSGNVIFGSFDGNSYGLDIRNADDHIILSTNGQSSTQPRLVIDPNGNTGIGTTNPTSKLTVQGTLSVSGVSTFSGNISVAGTVTADTMVFTNNGGSSLNGSLTINNVSASYTELFFRDSSGSVQSNIQGGTNLSLNPGGNGYISLGTYSYFYPNGDVSLNNGNQGTTLIRNQVHVQSGITSFYDNVSVGGTISVNGGVKLATNNATIVGTSGTVGEIKRIGGAPFFYDGSAWREFVLSAGAPVSVPADTEWDSVVFRATFDTDFTDAKFGATPVYVSAGSTTVGSPVKIGTGAYRNSGGYVTGIGLSYAYRSDYDFTGSWTIEFWIYHDSAPASFESLISQFSTANSSGDWTFGLYSTGSSIQWYWYNKNGTSHLINSVSNSAFNSTYLDKWNHYALVRQGNDGSLHFYINGTESGYTYNNSIIDNNILHINGAGLYIGSPQGGGPTIQGATWNSTYSIDAIFDDVRISCGVGTAGQRYTSVGIYTAPTFTPPTTALPTTGTLSSYIQPPGDKYGEIGLGTSPTWRGTSGVTVTQQSSGNYRVSFASSYTNRNDYYVLSQGMDQGFASYVGIARSTTHVDLSINRQSNDAAVDTGSLSVQIKNHI